MRKPEWIKARLPQGEEFARLNRVLSSYNLKTVCSSARCPNLGECWGKGVATIMILGEICTRHCGFCAVKTGNPEGKLDEGEPVRVARAVKELLLKYVVITSVDRDDLEDFGAGVFARTVRLIKKENPEVKVEVLVPDFNAQDDLLKIVISDAQSPLPDVFGHNLETVKRLTPVVRDRRAGYQKSLEVLRKAKEIAPAILTKSGLILGLGETEDEVFLTLQDLRSVSCDIVTIGQYLQPCRRCLPVVRYYNLTEFKNLEQMAREMGFKQVFVGPMVRSSFRAEELFRQV
ncbi:MAG: lipoyl synthase [bacterium]